MKNRNLIGSRIGMNDHMMSNKYTSLKFPDAKIYIDIINKKGDTGECIDNQYVDDEWIISWINANANKTLGKPRAFYVYNVDYDGINRPNKTDKDDNVIGDDILYSRANGVMYYDFDNLDKETIELIRQAFIDVCQHYSAFQWFERSWSGTGCHIRIQFDLKFKHKAEWMFIYFMYLHILMTTIKKYIKNPDINVEDWYTNNVIDWSCAAITRGFAIPYNEDKVLLNNNFIKENTLYESIEDFNYCANSVFGFWPTILYEKFLTKINKRKQPKPKLKRMYEIINVHPDVPEMYSGETFDYNWRLKCVTTLMGLYDGDKERVRNACRYIYSFIKPYKNHTYNEMIHYELENKIFQNGDMSIGIFHSIISDLKKYFGFEFKDYYRANDQLYLSEFHKNII